MDIPTSPTRKYTRLLPKPMPLQTSLNPTSLPSRHTAAFTKREVIRVACGRCAKRKSKCDGLRPSCSACFRTGVACLYDVEREQGRTNFLRRQNQLLTEENNTLHCLFDTLRSAPREEAYEILRRLNASDSLEETAKLVRDSSLLLLSIRGAHHGSPSASTTSSLSAASSTAKSTPCSSPAFPGGVDILGPCTPHRNHTL